MENLHICIIGGTGRLGKRIVSLCPNHIIICSKSNKEMLTDPKIDLFIDVSAPNVIAPLLPLIIKSKKPLVVGSTGHNDLTMKELKKASALIPLLIASNFSKGLFFLKRMLKAFALTPSVIIDTHHIHKKDTPSGTAKELSLLYKEPPSIISHRTEEAIGTHSMLFTFPFEEIEIKHTAHFRELFAKGAIEALSFLYQKEAGLYTMEDVYTKGSL